MLGTHVQGRRCQAGEEFPKNLTKAQYRISNLVEVISTAQIRRRPRDQVKSRKII